MSDYPYAEHARLDLVRDTSQAQGAFVEWLLDRGYHIARLKCPHGYEPMETCVEDKYCRRGVNSPSFWEESVGLNWLKARLAEYHDIDLAKLEQEKDAMLQAIRLGKR